MRGVSTKEKLVRSVLSVRVDSSTALGRKVGLTSASTVSEPAAVQLSGRRR